MTNLTRLAKRVEFMHVKNANCNFVLPYVIIQIAPNNLLGKHSTRVGFTASKKVGNAVKRNYAKRKMRAFVNRQKNQLLNSVDYVFIARRAILYEKFCAIEATVIGALTKLNKRISLQKIDVKLKI